MKKIIFACIPFLFLSCSSVPTLVERNLSSGAQSEISLEQEFGKIYGSLNPIYSGSQQPNWEKFDQQLGQISERISTSDSNLQDRIMEQLGAPSGEARIEWIRSTPWILTINGYVEEASNDEGNLYTQLNRSLRSGKALSKKLKDYDIELRQALKNLPDIEGYTFRGAVWSEKELQKYEPGELIVEKGYLSTSLIPAVANRFSKLSEGAKPSARSVIFVIRGRSGKPVSIFSEYWPEMESLFAPGIEFRVVARSPEREDRRVYILLEEK